MALPNEPATPALFADTEVATSAIVATAKTPAALTESDDELLDWDCVLEYPPRRERDAIICTVECVTRVIPDLSIGE